MSAGAPKPKGMSFGEALAAHGAGRVLSITTARGNREYWNPERRRRRELERLYGITTGRQWKRLRRALRRAAQGRT